ncbi:MAG: AAA family ATPase [Sulfuricurvum sp.]
MQITKIDLINYRGISKQAIKLLPNINVFVGINGSGKSTVLDAIALSLSWFVEGIEKIESQGKNIPDESIKNGEDYASIQLAVLEKGKEYQWENVEFRRGYPADKSSNLLGLNQLVYETQKAYKNEHQLPVIAYYPTSRIAKGLAQGFSATKSFSQMDVYENALGSYANFETFFEWFRLQDDIVNEHTTSRTKWMREHKRWIFRNLKRAFSYLKNQKNDREIDTFINRLLEKDEFLLEEPRYLFHEIQRIIRYSDDRDSRDGVDVDYLLHRMSRLLDAEGEDEYLLREIERFYRELEQCRELFDLQGNQNNISLNFIWEMFLFSVQLSFWRLSQKGRNSVESILNNYKISDLRKIFPKSGFIKEISDVLLQDKQRVEHALDHQDKELEIVKNAIEKFIHEYKNLRITRIPTPRMLIDKNGETLSLNQLSDGEKNMIAMIGDIARRLAMANPTLKNPLEGDGIILIDELDLHLHPAWQRVIVSKLTEVFPNCQFVVSTHSPQILSHVKADHIFLLKQEKNTIRVIKPSESYGKSSDRQLEDILGVASRPLAIKEKLHQLFELIQENNLPKAKALMSKLADEIEGREPELVKANVLIQRKEILGK